MGKTKVMLSKEAQDKESNGRNKQHEKALIKSVGEVEAIPRSQECLGNLPSLSKNAVWRKTLEEPEKQGSLKALCCSSIHGKFEHMLHSDKYPPACGKLTGKLAATRHLINQTLNKPLRVENRAEQPELSRN